MTALLIIDTETTGLDPDRARLLEIGAVLLVDGAIKDTLRIPIIAELDGADPKALEINRYHDRAAAGEWRDAIPEAMAVRVIGMAARLATPAYWTAFDGVMLGAAATRAGIDRQSTMWSRGLDLASMAALVRGRDRLCSLVRALEMFKLDPIPDTHRHTALGDAHGAARVAIAMGY